MLLLIQTMMKSMCVSLVLLCLFHIRDDVLAEEELGHTRSGLVFSAEAARTYNMPITKVDKIYKIPGQLQWLVIDSSRNTCWVFFSKVQQRFKCRTQHPNNPGMFCVLRAS